MSPEEVEQVYDRLKKVRTRLEKAEVSREQAAAERAELWESLLGAGEKHVAIARASGVHKSYINKELTRRAAKKAG